MKILLVGYPCSPYEGGDAGVTWNWARSLAARHEVWALVHPHDREGIERYLRAHPEPALHVVFVKPAPVARWLGRGLLGPGLRLRYVLWQRAALREAARLHRLHTFDVAHHVSWGTVSSAPLLWKLRIPFVWGPVGGGQTSPRAFRRYYGKAWAGEVVRSARLRALPYLGQARVAARHSAAALATNHETAELLSRLGARNVSLFLDSGIQPGGLPESAPRPAVNPELKLLWAGAHWPHKALPLALDALKWLGDLPVRLTVAGDGPMRPSWERHACRLGLRNRVQFLGRVKWARMPEIYRQADLFLFTSLRDSFGGVMLEAMAQGLPVVTLDHQGARAFVPPEASIKVPVTHPEETAQALAKAVRELYDSPLRRHAMGEAGWEFASTQTWERRAERMSALYEQAIRENETGRAWRSS